MLFCRATLTAAPDLAQFAGRQFNLRLLLAAVDSCTRAARYRAALLPHRSSLGSIDQLLRGFRHSGDGYV
jgi:hypothetical protein